MVSLISFAFLRPFPRSLRVVKGGAPGVFYDDEGRPSYPDRGEISGRDQWKSQLRPDDYVHYDPTRRSDRSGYTPDNSGNSRAIITKRFDDYRRDASPVVGPPMTGYVGTREVVRERPGYVEKYRREGTVILEERIVSHERPWAWPLFLIIGLLLIITGVLVLLFCIEDYYYSHFWVGILVSRNRHLTHQ